VAGAAVAYIGLVLVAGLVAGCSKPEPPVNGYWVWNYSASGYVVRVVNSAGFVDTVETPAVSRLHRFLGNFPPQRVIVYDNSCSAKLADLSVPEGVDDANIVIDGTGAVSIPVAYDGLAPGTYPPGIVTMPPLPSGCLANIDGGSALAP
jgi:hypothetical protein